MREEAGVTGDNPLKRGENMRNSLSKSRHTIERDIPEWVVTEWDVMSSSVALVTLLTEHPLPEHFTKQESAVMITSHVVIDLPLTERKS